MAQSNRTLSAQPVVRIAVAGVALGVALMMLALAIIQGFQHEVKGLVVGFDSHVQVIHSDPLMDGVVVEAGLRDSLLDLEGVGHVSFRHERAGIAESNVALQGVVVRGVDHTSYQPKIEQSLTEGTMVGPEEGQGVVVGLPLARKLDVGVGDKITLYLVLGQADIKPRPLRVVGIYDTGLMEFDQRTVWVSASLIQQATARGAEGQILVESDPPRAVGQAFGRDRLGARWTGHWAGLPDGMPNRRAIPLEELSFDDSLIWVVGSGTLADSVTLRHQNGEWVADVSKGTHDRVVDGMDLWASSLEDTEALQTQAFSIIPYDWQAVRVDQQHPEMFGWLDMLDLNVEVIVGLMVLISIINMTSALLIIILERRSQVGLLKALGMTDSHVVRTFMWHAARILGRGFLWGNLVGGACLWVQSTWRVIPLDPEAYYVDAVPVLVDVPRIAALELLAFGLCVAAMLLPSLWSTRIRPALSLRMQ